MTEKLFRLFSSGCAETQIGGKPHKTLGNAQLRVGAEPRAVSAQPRDSREHSEAAYQLGVGPLRRLGTPFATPCEAPMDFPTSR